MVLAIYRMLGPPPSPQTPHPTSSWWRHQTETFSLCAGNRWIPRRGQWRGTLMFSLSCAWNNGWANNREAGDLRRHRANYYVTVMFTLKDWCNTTAQRTDKSISAGILRTHSCNFDLGCFTRNWSSMENSPCCIFIAGHEIATNFAYDTTVVEKFVEYKTIFQSNFNYDGKTFSEMACRSKSKAKLWRFCLCLRNKPGVFHCIWWVSGIDFREVLNSWMVSPSWPIFNENVA